MGPSLWGLHFASYKLVQIQIILVSQTQEHLFLRSSLALGGHFWVQAVSILGFMSKSLPNPLMLFIWTPQIRPHTYVKWGFECLAAFPVWCKTGCQGGVHMTFHSTPRLDFFLGCFAQTVVKEP